MVTATVKWFSAVKHYGFIAPDEGGPEVFVHRSTLTAASVESLDERARVSFEFDLDRARPAAVNLAVLETRAGE